MTAFAAVLLSLTLAVQGQDVRAEAERLARSGAHEQALKRFQELAAANPQDLDARLWIGRLHREMGHARRAASVFESIVATAPQNVDALLGLALAEMDAGRWPEASAALSRAEALAAERIDVLAAQGRYHAAEGRSTLALAYYGRALVVEPSNAAIRQASDAVRAARAHRVTIGYDLQDFDEVADSMHGGTLDVNVRLSDRVRVFARGQAQRFGDADEGRGGGGFEWLAHRTFEMHGGALFGSDNVWLPATEVFAKGTMIHRRTRWSLGVNYFDFDVADLWIGGPGVEFDLTPRVTLQAEYLRGRTSVEFGDSSGSNNGMLGLAAQISSRVRGSVAYHRGIDRLRWLTIDRLGADKANTFSGEIGADVTPFVNLSAAYDYSDRSSSGPSDVQRARAWLTYRF